jgi:uncharacterized protein (TIGR02001 family)
MQGALMVGLVPLCMLVAQPLAAQKAGPLEFEGSVSLVSDYRFRGISQTLEEMAIQAGIDVSGPSGLYLGVWGSNLNFGEALPTGRAQAEIDMVAGVRHSLGELVDVDLGVIYYHYPGTLSDYRYDFVEMGLAASRDFRRLSTEVSAAFSPNYFAGSGSSTYVSGGLGIPIPSTPVTLRAAVGRQTIDDNAAFGTPNYVDWKAGVATELWALELEVAYVGTNLDRADCFGGADLCRRRVVFGLSVAR